LLPTVAAVHEEGRDAAVGKLTFVYELDEQPANIYEREETKANIFRNRVSREHPGWKEAKCSLGFFMTSPLEGWQCWPANSRPRRGVALELL